MKVAQASDAALAARLQAEENSRVRPTRGIDKRKRSSAPKKGDKIKKRKSANKVRAEDDSDLAGESGEEKPKKRNGAFHVSQHVVVTREPIRNDAISETDDPFSAVGSVNGRDNCKVGLLHMIRQMH